mmetsp:Transcript_14216/g.18003  ORF Transcript_14216/g.18003 Transcript_14216/m.18003 type:complete len:102 (-) Transcript_14216:50-355(-)
MKVLQFCALSLGLLLLVHCAISVKQHQNLLLDLDEPYDGIPTDLYVECIAAMLISCVSIVWSSRPFSSIMISTVYSKKSHDDLHTRPEFMIFNHRGMRMNR